MCFAETFLTIQCHQSALTFSNFAINLDVFTLIECKPWSWEEACGIGVCRAGAGIAVVDCRIEILRDITKMSLIPPGTNRNRWLCMFKYFLIITWKSMDFTFLHFEYFGCQRENNSSFFQWIFVFGKDILVRKLSSILMFLGNLRSSVIFHL